MFIIHTFTHTKHIHFVFIRNPIQTTARISISIVYVGKPLKVNSNELMRAMHNMYSFQQINIS